MARTANLLGATALAVADLTLAELTGAAGLSASGAAALVAMSARSSGMGVGEVGRHVGLTQSAAVRMVDTLQAAGLVVRRRAPGRAVGVELTPEGHRLAERLRSVRSRRLVDLVSVLDVDERGALTGLLGTLLARLYVEVGSSDVLCRLCDRGVCTAGATCPVGQAARDAGH